MTSSVGIGASLEKAGWPDTLAVSPVRNLRRFDKQGYASTLVAAEAPWAEVIVKVPKGGTAGAATLPGREWVYGRLGWRLGLPTAPQKLVVVPVESLPDDAADASTLRSDERVILTATHELGLADQRLSWRDLSERDRAALFVWENVTNVRCGDKVRPDGPRDFYRLRDPQPAEAREVMLDLEGMPTVWDIARSGTDPPLALIPESDVAVEETTDDTLRSAIRAARHCLCDREWCGIIDGSDLLPDPAPEQLRNVMAARVDALTAWIDTRH